jgi:nucleoside-diphosphate-sugar epimerase
VSRRILFTGSSGFIGRHYFALLKEISSFDIYTLGRGTYSHSDSGQIIDLDLRDFENYSQLRKYEFDEIFHFAWYGLPDRGKATNRINLQICENLIATLRSQKEITLNFLGSCLEYDNDQGGVDDHITPLNKSDFALTKREIHRILRNTNLKYRWFRPFFVYGIGQNPLSIVPSIVQSMKKGKLPSIMNPFNTHDFISVIDLADSILKLSVNTDSYGPFNLGTGTLTSVQEIVDIFFPESSHKKNTQMPNKDGLYSRSRQLKKLNWKPRYLGSHGIREYVENSGMIENL